MELLVLLIIVYACKHAITDTKGAAAKSRAAYLKSADERFPDMPKGKRAAHAARHDLGWFLSQLGHGFPATRHGFAQGWHESRQAHHEAMAGAQEAKTRHLETRAGLIPQLSEYKARQQAALEQIRSGKTPSKPEAHDVDGTCAYCGAEDGERCKPDCPYGSMNWREVRRIQKERRMKPGAGLPEEKEVAPEGTSPGPAEAEAEAEEAAPNASPGGTTVTEDHWDDPLPGEGIQREGRTRPCRNCDRNTNSPNGLCGDCSPEFHEKPTIGREEGTPEGTSSSTPKTSPTPTASTEGNPVSDTTFDGVLTHASNVQVQEENTVASRDARIAEADAMSEDMQALKVDSGTLSLALEHRDAQVAAKEAEQAAAEAAQALHDALNSNHGAVAEAHQNAPEGGAEREFYAA